MKLKEFAEDLETCTPYGYTLLKWKKRNGIFLVVTTILLIIYYCFCFSHIKNMIALNDYNNVLYIIARLVNIIVPASLVYTLCISFWVFIYPEINYIIENKNKSLAFTLIFTIITFILVFVTLFMKSFILQY